MDISVFTDKTKQPEDNDLAAALGDTFTLWKKISAHVYSKYPDAKDEWNYPGAKYGWSFRIKDKKRVIIYLLPRDHFFKIAMVFGDKAVDEIMKSAISDNIKDELQAAKKYAEGRGIRIDVKDSKIVQDIKKLIEIKLDVA